MASARNLFGDKPRTKNSVRPEDHVKGHRARLRDRFLSGGPAAVTDYELLELLLFRAIPRRDVKPLAKRLLARFGDFHGVVAAEIGRLREVDGLGDAGITELKIVEAAALKLSRHRAQNLEVLSNGDAVLAYLQASMARRATEEFRVLFLDRKNQLIRDEVIGKGTVDQITVYPREVVKRTLELGASGIIIAHNHPSGDPTPSQADIVMTQKLSQAAAALDVALLDHFIIGADDWTSFKSERLL
jgi:DNA repair protein RadC